MPTISNTAVGRYYKVYQDGGYVSQHTTEREALEKCTNILLAGAIEVKYVHEYEVIVKWESMPTMTVATNTGSLGLIVD